MRRTDHPRDQAVGQAVSDKDMPIGIHMLLVLLLVIGILGLVAAAMA